jgi:hypothetical protein
MTGDVSEKPVPLKRKREKLGQAKGHGACRRERDLETWFVVLEDGSTDQE